MKKYLLIIIAIFFLNDIFPQKNPYKEYRQEEYDLAIELFNKKLYKSASNIFYELSQDENFKKTKKDIKCKYYFSICEVYAGQKNTDKLLEQFLRENKNEVDPNETYYQVANFFFNNIDFKRAQLWYEKIDRTQLMADRRDDYFFEIGFSQYKNKDYYKAKPNLFFASKTEKYGKDATYYYSHIAYEEEMYSTALKQMPKIKNEKKYSSIIPRYEVQMLFLHRRYKEALELGENILIDTTLKKKDKEGYIDLSKILADCYFELKNYNNSIKYYEELKKETKLSNTEHYKIGYSYYINGNYNKSIENLNKIISENSSMGQNAYYYLADSYLKEGKKTEAFNAFKKTSEMDFDTIIKKDAFFNYAKISYDIGNPYENAIEIMNMYIAKYPDDLNSSRLREMVASAYVLADRFEEAINYVDKNKKKSHEIENLIQYVSFKRAMEYIHSGKYSQALEYLEKTIENGYEIDLKNRSVFWKGECNYKLGDSKKAILDFKEYLLSKNLENYYETKFINYNLGYVYFEMKDYINSLDYFKKYKEKVKDSISNDAILRIADCYFILGETQKALDNYRSFIDREKIKYNDYAHYNIAICYGIQGKNDLKIEKLNFIISNFKSSYLIDKVTYELAMAYLKKDDSETAIKYFEKVEKDFPYSELRIDSKQKRALIYYNKNNYQKTINIYKEIVKDYPNTNYSKQAMGNLKKIYVEKGNIDDYVQYVDSIEFIDFSNEELDSLAFFDVESIYMEGKYSLAEPKLLDYKKRFPKGIFSNDVTFYTAETFFKQNKKDESIIFYREVLSYKNSIYSIQSLKRLINIYEEKKDVKSLISSLEELRDIDKSSENILYCDIELCKLYYSSGDIDKAYSSSKKILEMDNLNKYDRNVISLISARCSIKLEKYQDAEKEYNYLESNNTMDEEKAESMYYVALFLFNKENYNKVIEKVSEMGDEVPEYKFWGGKALILMAKSFYKLNDEYQANYIIESVIANIFYEEIQKEAKEFLEYMKKNRINIESQNIQKDE